jgi:hypothetical protein
MEGIADDRRRQFLEEAAATVQRAHPGVFETTARNHVLVANT